MFHFFFNLTECFYPLAMSMPIKNISMAGVIFFAVEIEEVGRNRKETPRFLYLSLGQLLGEIHKKFYELILNRFEL